MVSKCLLSFFSYIKVSLISRNFIGINKSLAVFLALRTLASTSSRPSLFRLYAYILTVIYSFPLPSPAQLGSSIILFILYSPFPHPHPQLFLNLIFCCHSAVLCKDQIKSHTSKLYSLLWHSNILLPLLDLTLCLSYKMHSLPLHISSNIL